MDKTNSILEDEAYWEYLFAIAKEISQYQEEHSNCPIEHADCHTYEE